MARFTERIERRGGAIFHVSDDSDLYVLREMYEMGNEKSVYKVDIKPGMRVLDLGAHKGIFAIWAAKQGAEVLAYEPHPLTFRTLCQNVRENDTNVKCFQVGVARAEGTAVIYSDPENSIMSSFRNIGPERFEVSVRTLDEIIGTVEWDILKVDIEGAEYETLLTSEKLRQVKYLALEWHNASPELVNALEQKLKQIFEINPFNPDWMIVSGPRTLLVV
jgi:FkbM family methyltransferase